MFKTFGYCADGKVTATPMYFVNNKREMIMGTDQEVCNFDTLNYSFVDYEKEKVIECVHDQQKVKSIQMTFREIPSERMLYTHLLIQMEDKKVPNRT